MSTVLTIAVNDVKRLAGIDSAVTTEDARITDLLAFHQPGWESQIDPVFLNDTSLQPRLAQGIAYLIADEAHRSPVDPASVSPGIIVDKKAGDQSIGYVNRTRPMGKDGVSEMTLYQIGMEILEEYMFAQSVMVDAPGAAPDMYKDLFDFSGNNVRPGNMGAAFDR